MNVTMQKAFLEPPATTGDALWEADYVRRAILKEAENPDFPLPPAGRWSLEDILYHLHLVERGSASAIRRMIEGEKGERISDEDYRDIWKRMLALIPTRNTKIPAPEGVSPKDTPPRADCIRLLAESRERLHIHCSKADDDGLLRTSFPHPVLGKIPGLLWITFIAMHEARHLEQIMELKSATQG